MNLLIVAATKLEIKPILKKLNCHEIDKSGFKSLIYNNLNIDILISGIGMVFTTFHLTKVIVHKNYDLVLNIGIAGGFDRSLQIGEIVQVTSEEFADLGIEDTDKFNTLFESGYINMNAFPFQNGKLLAKQFNNKIISKIKKVTAITSNVAHGRESSINFLQQKFDSGIETMEGAAFFYVCLMLEVKFVQLRAISNYVESRNIQNWDIPSAINNLSEKLFQIFDSLSQRN